MMETVIIAMGNPLMSDEGIGTRVLEVLAERGVPDGVELRDLGTNGLAVIHAIEGRRKAIFIDCAHMGLPPGSVRRFTPDEVETAKVEMRLSQHEGDLLVTLELAKSLNVCPEEVVLIGVQPGSMELGMDLTPEVAAQVETCVAMVTRELEAVHA